MALSKPNSDYQVTKHDENEHQNEENYEEYTGGQLDQDEFMIKSDVPGANTMMRKTPVASDNVPTQEIISDD